MQRTLFGEDHELFRQSVRAFVEKEIAPHHLDWEAAGAVPRELFRAAGAQGFLCMSAPARVRRRRCRRLPLTT